MMPDELQLIEPTETLRKALLEFVKEFARSGEEYVDGTGGWHGDFAAYIRRVRNHAQGANVQPDRVPDSTFWLVRGDAILGVCNLRHRLNEKLYDFGGHIGYSVRPSERNKGYATRMLKMALAKARELGIGRVRVTCAKDNPASRRVIVKNGGVLDSEGPREGEPGRVTQRFWIDLGSQGSEE